MSRQVSAGDTLVPSLLVFAYAAATTTRASAEFPHVRAEMQVIKSITPKGGTSEAGIQGLNLLSFFLQAWCPL